MNRLEITSKILATLEQYPEIETDIVDDAISDVINEIENVVTEAFDHLNDIKNVGNLSAIEDCFDVLKKLKKDLY
jgi:hypothetical protein